MRVLKMLEEKKITADEAARLLDAIEGTKPDSYRNRFLKVKVWKSGSEKPKVNITLPVSLVKLGLRFAPDSARAQIAEHNLDLNQVSEALQKGITGKIVDIEETEKDEHVEVWLE
ncbi:hypothetical protein CH330_02945 [candidate division WOR-3 bacterium JGI_Cruoil_03_51_56]|uniref:YvlB/LiaX N-terminal domain-containing protein n=1 Tax=candidate division WOR-3 bacterium JGI_Cruoil_03_51_56 TaxID=1973747 RepID=A0A235BVK2_UNCW3|nr:MAG: hypothetical protein CH330_02945 [candidate division WOR-3 bacterium JGI_Cruoil_03_51_56]